MASNSKTSWVVPGRYPPAGTSPVADKIRDRRGERGLTPLDGTLLHVPSIANGWNTLLGAVRTAGKLPGDVRELMILRVAALNHAAFEWIHHEHVGRACGLTIPQLFIIRDTVTPLPPGPGVLSSFQISALVFADQSTRKVQVEKETILHLKAELGAWLRTGEKGGTAEEEHDQVGDLVVEAAAVVGSYNMVSRFLVSMDVAGGSQDSVPWPVERREHLIPIPNSTGPDHTIHAITLIASPSAPWLIFANSLLTDLTMWNPIIPYLLNPANSDTGYNILIHSQRGHGRSTLPNHQDGTKQITITGLAQDIHQLLVHLSIPLPVHAVIGVSQGGAAALSFAVQYPNETKSIISCDTGPKTPAGNQAAWEERIALALGTSSTEVEKTEYAAGVGMGKLADTTIPRWFPPGSPCNPGNEGESDARPHVQKWLRGIVSSTPVYGFAAGARALSDYDVIAEGLFKSSIGKVLLLAGALDGGGKVGDGLENLKQRWNEERLSAGRPGVKFVRLAGSGHLPMVDRPEKFAEVVIPWLRAG